MTKLNVPYRYIQKLPPQAQQEIFRNFEEVAKVMSTVGGSSFDATIDPGLAADVPALGRFTTVRAALTYYSGLGYATGQSLCFAMRGRAVSLFGTTSAVTETANIPSTIFPPSGLKIVGLGGAVTWNMAGFTITGSGNVANLILQDIYVVAGGSNAPLLGMSYLHFEGGGFKGNNVTPISTGAFVYADRAWFQACVPGASLFQWYSNSSWEVQVSATTTVASGVGTLAMYGCHIQGASNDTTNWNVASTRAIFVECEGASTASQSDAYMALNFTGGTTQSVYVMGGGRGGGNSRASGFRITMVGTKENIVVMGGRYIDVSTAGLTSPHGGTQIIQCSVLTGLDITGPAVVNCFTGTYAALRGNNISGTVAIGGFNNGTLLFGVALTNSNVAVALSASTLALAVPYNLDASSTRNVLIVTGTNGMGAGINTGANNLIITESGFSGGGTAPPRKVTATIGDGVSTAIDVVHNFTTTDVVVEVYDASTGETVNPQVTRPTTAKVTLTFSVAPVASAYKVVVLG